jgi:transcription-repair coupling factor (superfamily II helicase)
MPRLVATWRQWPVDQAFIDWTEIERRSATGARLEELSLEDEAGVEQVSCQPAMEFRGRVGDWVADIRQARERGDTVLFVADSAGRAERTVEILRDYEIVAVPVEDAGAHAAAVLIAVGTLSRGFRLAQASLQVYAETDVFEEERRPSEKRRSLAQRFYPTCETSRSAISWSMSIMGSGSSSVSSS